MPPEFQDPSSSQRLSDRLTTTYRSATAGTFRLLTVDTTPPAMPFANTPADGSRMNSNTPTYSGTAEADSTVTIFVDGAAAGTTTADASGNWSFSPSAPLGEGSHTVRSTATDAAGNTSVDSNTNSFIVDTIPPAAPVSIVPANGAGTNDNTPTYSGTAQAGSAVTIYVDGSAVGTTGTNGSGGWSFTPTTPIADGSHTVRSTATDGAGNISTLSNTNTFTVDTTPPNAPVPVTPANGSSTSDNTPTYSGTAEAGSTVTIFVDGSAVGTTTANGSGAWSFTPTTAVSDGPHTIRSRAVDAVGNTSVDSNTNTFIVDTTPPAAPVSLTPANGASTNDNTPTYVGTAEPGSTVAIVVDGTFVGTTTADGGGNWSFTPTTPVADGAHTVRSSATDVSGNTSSNSNTNTFTVDTTPPAAPVSIVPANGAGTNDNTPTYSGTAQAGSAVTIYVDGSAVGTTGTNGSGGWSFTPTTPIADGSHTVRSTATDGAGNISTLSNTNTFTVDTTPPNAPVPVTPANGSSTSDNTPTYSGTAEAGSTVTIFVDGSAVGTTTANGSGAWSFTPTTAVSDGPHTIRSRAVDAVGNTSVDSNTNTFIVDTTPPAAPVSVTPANGGSTNDNTPTYSGTAEANSTVAIVVDGTFVGTTTANGSGSWSFSPTTPIADGSHTVRSSATDVAGNTSSNSNTNTFTVDTTPPAAPVAVVPANGAGTSDNTPTFSGTAEANSTVTVMVDGVAIGTTTANGSGGWSLTQSTPLTDGSHNVRSTATDVAGNTSSNSNTNTFTVDTTPPPAPVSITPANGGQTGDNTPTYSGTAEANSTVTIYVDGSSVGTATADGSGNWSFTPSSSVVDGSHTVRSRATDAAGNTSPDSNTNSFTVDTTPPSAPVPVTPANGGSTNDNTPTYSGTAEAGSTVTIIVDGSAVGTTTANGSGNWSFTPTTAVSDGSHTIRTRAADAVGNASVDSNTNTFTVDTTPPAAPVSVVPANGGSTGDNTPTYSGTAEPNSTVTIYVDGSSVGTTTADGSGNWSFTPTTPMADGSHTVRSTAADASGNTSSNSNTNTFTVDTTPPGAPVSTTPADGGSTNDSTPTYSGTAEAGSTVTIIVDGSSVGTATANGSGAWSFTPTTPISDGSHTVSSTATDAAGNTGPSSVTNTFTLDATAPATPVANAPADGSSTNDDTPTYSGTAEAGSTVTIVVDGTSVGTATADADGNWSLAQPSALLAGTHSVHARATDAFGNQSGDSADQAFTVDLTPPAVPVVTSPAPAALVADATPTLSGTADPNASIEVSDGGTVLATVTADGSGDWSYPATLAQGEHGITAIAIDAAGNRSDASTSVDFVVDSIAPDLGAITLAETDAGREALVTASERPTFTGTAETGTDVVVTLDGVSHTLTPVDGSWSYQAEAPLAPGMYTVEVTSTDAAGNAATPVTATVEVVGAPVATADPVTSSGGHLVVGSTQGRPVFVVVDGVPISGEATNDVWRSDDTYTGTHTVYTAELDEANRVVVSAPIEVTVAPPPPPPYHLLAYEALVPEPTAIAPVPTVGLADVLALGSAEIDLSALVGHASHGGFADVASRAVAPVSAAGGDFSWAVGADTMLAADNPFEHLLDHPTWS